MKSTNRSRQLTIATVLIALVLIVAFFFLIWIPKGKQITAANANLATLQSQNATTQAEIATLVAFQAQLPTATAELVRLQTAIPTYPDLANFILAMNSISNESGISFISISPSQPAPEVAATTGTSPLPPDVSLSVQVKGGYFQVLDFLNRLDNMPRLVVTSSLSISGSGSTLGGAASSGSQISASIKAAIYSQSIPPGVPGLPTVSTTTTTAAPNGSATTSPTTTAG